MKRMLRLSGAITLAACCAGASLAGEGKVVSSVNTDMYTYVEIEQNGKNVWVAAPTVVVKAGDQVRFDDGAVMTNFHSKQLQRTFPSVMFVQRVAIAASDK
jgi:hypothetical protein